MLGLNERKGSPLIHLTRLILGYNSVDKITGIIFISRQEILSVLIQVMSIYEHLKFMLSLEKLFTSTVNVKRKAFSLSCNQCISLRTEIL